MPVAYRYEVFAGNAPDAFAAHALAALPITQMLEITCWDNPCVIELSYDNVTFGGDIEIDNSDPPILLPFAMKSFKIKNKTAGLVSRYQIVGFL